MIIENEEQYEIYKKRLVKKWKPIFEEEREKSGDAYKAIRKNFAEFFADVEPIWGYALILDLTGRFENLADIKEIPYGRNT